MTLSQKQAEFFAAVARLSVWATATLGSTIKVCEWYRTPETERQYIASGKSKLKDPADCKHCVGLAVDLALLDHAGQYLDPETHRDLYRPLGEKWE